MDVRPTSGAGDIAGKPLCDDSAVQCLDAVFAKLIKGESVLAANRQGARVKSARSQCVRIIITVLEEKHGRKLMADVEFDHGRGRGRSACAVGLSPALDWFGKSTRQSGYVTYLIQIEY